MAWRKSKTLYILPLVYKMFVFVFFIHACSAHRHPQKEKQKTATNWKQSCTNGTPKMLAFLYSYIIYI